ncbi:EcsC family protein [Nakamurella lactea]|uniref:EcsC family protein n=1 Tax=Nakamurella lactea TaxID=459515 RepID=UPI00040D8E11|nr:EcsC family protein [Nakamurella lactea]
MGVIGDVTGRAAWAFGRKLAPAQAAGFVRSVLDRAIDGVGPLGSAAKSADKQLRASGGAVEVAIRELIDGHVKLAGAEGFITNLGGFITAAVTIPANITGLALIQCHLVAGIAHLRGYDLRHPNVRSAVLACLLGKSGVRRMVRDGTLPAGPAELATATTVDPELNARVSRMITGDLITAVGGKRVAIFIGKRIPLAGGAIGGAADGYGTWQIGRFAAKELRPAPRAPYAAR